MIHKVKAKDNPSSKLFKTIILCMMMLGTHWVQSQTTCNKYPRYLVSQADSNFILSMDMHFPSDLLVYVGTSLDYNLNKNTLCDWCDIPVIVAMSIAEPTYKWTLAAVEWDHTTFTDVDISDDGAKVVITGSSYDNEIQVILWVLNTSNGSVISQKVVQVLSSSGSTSLSLTSRLYKQALISSSQPVIYLLMRTNNPHYLAKLDYASGQPLWSLQTNPSQLTQIFSQIAFGGSSSSTLETSLYVVVPVGSKYQISRISEDGTIQWAYEFPLNAATSNTEAFIEYALNDDPTGDNTLVIATNQYYITVMKVSNTELIAVAGPQPSSIKLFQEPNYSGVTSAIYVKPSSTKVYLLKKPGSYYYIGQFSTTALTITYKLQSFHCEYDTYQPRGIFKDETNYFAALNCYTSFFYRPLKDIDDIWYYFRYSTGTSYSGGLIFASSQTLNSSCYSIPSFQPYTYTMKDQTALLVAVAPSSATWQTIVSPVVIQVADDAQSLTSSLDKARLKQSETSCPVYSHNGTSQLPTPRFLNYVSGVSSQFNFTFSKEISFPGTTSPTLSYYLESELNQQTLDPMSFMSINALNGTISFESSSFSSNYTHNVTVKAIAGTDCILVKQNFTLYDLRLYLADIKNVTMATGDKMIIKTTWYYKPWNYLWVEISLIDAPLPSAPYFIQYDSYYQNLTIAPTNISHIGAHTLLFKVRDSAGQFYDHVIWVNVTNRAPYFDNNITNYNYSTTLNNITTFILPAIVSPDLGSPIVRVISNHTFVTIVSQGTDILMKVHALELNLIDVHYVSLEVLIPNYTNTTIYSINLRINNTLPKFYMPLEDYHMGLYWNEKYKIPKFTDPDGGKVFITWGFKFDFIKFESTTNTFTFNPMDVDMAGEYIIMVTLTDQHDGAYSEDFTIWVHRPPMFAVQMKNFYSMKVGSVFELELPLYETDGIEISLSSLPGFAKLDQFLFIFKPTTLPHLGIFLIKGRMKNRWGSLKFDFSIEVTNEPPSLSMKPKDLVILQDYIFTQVLPTAQDPEDQPITIKMAEVGQNLLPQFVTFNPITKECILAPTKQTKIGIFMIQVDVYDSMNYFNTYRFKIQVLAYTSLKKEQYKENQANIMQEKSYKKFQRYQARLIIDQVTRDGRATLKLAARNGKAEQLAIQVNNETFSIRLLREEQVRYEVESVNEDRGTIEIKLLFFNPSNVSNKIESDKLEVKVIRYLEFENDMMHIELKEGQIDQKFVPPQMTSGQEAVSYFSGGSIKLSNSTAENYVVSIVLQNLWVRLEDMSFMSINNMISIPVPGLVQLINNVIMNFIFMDIFLSDQWMPQLFYGYERVNEDSEPLNSFFDESGYSSKMLLKNINSSLVFIWIYCSLQGLLLILRILASCSQRVMLAYENFRKKLFWSISIKFFENQYPPLLSASLINLFDLKFDNEIHAASSVMSLAILLASGIAILLMIYHLYQARKNRKLRSKDFRQRLGALTEGQRKKSFPGVYWRPLGLLRWTATMLIMTLLRHNFYLQIFMLLAISIIFQLMILGSKPMLKKLDNRMLLFNEVLVSIYLYLLLCLTDFMVEHDKREQIAWALLILIVFTVAANLVKFIIVFEWCFICRKIKKKCIKLKKQDMYNQDTIKTQNEGNDQISIAEDNSEKGEKNKRKKKKKIVKKKKLVRPSHQIDHHYNDEIFKTQAHNQDTTNEGKNEQSFSAAYVFGKGFQRRLDDDQEIKKEASNQLVPLPYRKNNEQVLVIESYNVDKESNSSPFRQEQKERRRLDQEVQPMMFEVRRLPEQLHRKK